MKDKMEPAEVSFVMYFTALSTGTASGIFYHTSYVPRLCEDIKIINTASP